MNIKKIRKALGQRDNTGFKELALPMADPDFIPVTTYFFKLLSTEPVVATEASPCVDPKNTKANKSRILESYKKKSTISNIWPYTDP